jgi:rod shape-determining protein MreD
MIYGYHFIVCLLLIVFQTTLLSGGSQVIPYDLLGPYVVFLGIYRPPREAVPVLLVCGLVMDGISGGVFGIHLTVYLWMYMGVRRAIGYLHAGNVFLLPLLVAAAVAFQSVVMALSALVLSASAWPVESIIGVVSRQVVWGAVTGPFVLLLIKRGMDLVVRARRAFTRDEDQLRTP